MLKVKFSFGCLRRLWVKEVVLHALRLGLNWAPSLVLALCKETLHIPSDNHHFRSSIHVHVVPELISPLKRPLGCHLPSLCREAQCF